VQPSRPPSPDPTPRGGARSGRSRPPGGGRIVINWDRSCIDGPSAAWSFPERPPGIANSPESHRIYARVPFAPVPPVGVGCPGRGVPQPVLRWNAETRYCRQLGSPAWIMSLSGTAQPTARRIAAQVAIW
jgi:hypothetical protein